MSVVASLIADLVAAGTPPELIGRVAAALADREPVVIVQKDEASERRRAADRERKARVRGIPQTSAESADSTPPDGPPSPPAPPLPPLNPPRVLVTAPATDDFDRFWAAYPKRPGNPRKPAAEKFARRIRDGTDPEVIIRAAEAYARLMAGKDPQFIAQAVTWLNQDRWKDDHSIPDTVARPGPVHGGSGGGRYPEGPRPARRNPMLDAWLEGKVGTDPAERRGSLDFDEPAFGGRTILVNPAQGRA